MKKYCLFLLTILITLTFISCNNTTTNTQITSLELEMPKTNTVETTNGYALFADNTYSADKTFVTRGYINNGSSYSYVNATIKAQKALDENQDSITIESNFKFDTNEIYTVWAEYNGLKSKPYNVCTYEANSVIDARIQDKPIPTGLKLSDFKKLIKDVKSFDENGLIKEASEAAINNIIVILYNSETDKLIQLSESVKTQKGYDLIIAYTDSTSPFFIIEDADIYDPTTDFNSIAIYNGYYDRANLSLAGLKYAKRYNGTTITTEGKCDPFTTDDGTTLKDNHYLTIKDGNIETTYNQNEKVDYIFEKNNSYLITLKVINGEDELTATKKIYF